MLFDDIKFITSKILIASIITTSMEFSVIPMIAVAEVQDNVVTTDNNYASHAYGDDTADVSVHEIERCLTVNDDAIVENPDTETVVTGQAETMLEEQSSGYSSPGTAKTVVANTRYTDALENDNSAKNWYRIDLSKAGKATILFENDYSDEHGGSAGWEVHLYDSTAKNELGSWRISSDRVGYDPALCDVGLPAGTYYIEVSRSWYVTTAKYHMEIKWEKSDDWEREPENESPDKATPLFLDGSSSFGVIEHSRFSDTDWWRFTVKQAGQVTIYFANDYSDEHGGSAGWEVHLYDSTAKNELEFWRIFSDRVGYDPVLYEAALPAGTYYIEVRRAWYPAHATYSLSVSCQLFSDVTASTAHSSDIYWLASNGISTGWDVKGRKEFRPYDKVARADMAAFLFRIARRWGIVKESWQPASKIPFTDVTKGTPHFREIMWLAESGISKGWDVKGRKEFRPYDKVARADMAAFLFRLQSIKSSISSPLSNPFRDVNASTAHYEEISWLAGSGISTGWTVGSGREFRPYEKVARADMAAFLHRLDNLD